MINTKYRVSIKTILIIIGGITSGSFKCDAQISQPTLTIGGSSTLPIYESGNTTVHAISNDPQNLQEIVINIVKDGDAPPMVNETWTVPGNGGSITFDFLSTETYTVTAYTTFNGEFSSSAKLCVNTASCSGGSNGGGGEVGCTPPANPIVTVSIAGGTCGDATLTYTPSKPLPADIDYVWLKDGIEYGRNPTITLASTAYISIIAENTSCQENNQSYAGWSQTVSVIQPPEAPPTEAIDIEYRCDGEFELSLKSGYAPPSGVEWYWVGSVASNESTTNAETQTYINYETPGGPSTNYYLKAKVENKPCWGGYTSVAVFGEYGGTKASNPSVTALNHTTTTSWGYNLCSPQSVSISFTANLNEGVDHPMVHMTKTDQSNNQIVFEQDYVQSGSITESFSYGDAYQYKFYTYAGTGTACPSDETIVAFQVGDSKNAGEIGNDQTVCGSHTGVVEVNLFNIAEAELTGFDGYLWQIFDGENWVNAAGPNTGADYSLTQQWDPGVHQFRRKAIYTDCAGSSSFASNEVYITVNDNLDPGLISSNEIEICYNDGVQINSDQGANGGGGPGTYSYQWYSSLSSNDPNPTPIFGETGLSLSISNLTQTTYFTRQVESCNLYAAMEIEIKVKALPPATPLNSNQFDGCVGGGDITISVPGNPHPSYIWTREGAVISDTDNQIIVSVAASSFDQYTLTGIQDDGCKTDAFLFEVNIHQYCDYTMNRVRSIDVLIPGITANDTDFDALPIEDYSQSKTYYDGLGRPIQQVVKMASPNQYDMVSPQVYDAFGRQNIQYLPYANSEIKGVYATNPPTLEDINSYPETEHHAFFHNTEKVTTDDRAYNETQYEASPLNRVMKTYGAGQQWFDNDKAVKFNYSTNSSDEVRLWSVVDNLPVNSSPNKYHDANTLYKNITDDEEDNEVIEYSNGRGQVLLKRVQVDDSKTIWADTYYVYDDFGNLRFVLPPEAVNHLDEYND